jgi:excisionase family DNA binding protein
MKTKEVQCGGDAFPPLMTVGEAASLVGVSRSSAYRAVEAGELPSVRLGRRLFVPTARLLEMLGVYKPQESATASIGRGREEWPWLV